MAGMANGFRLSGTRAVKSLLQQLRYIPSIVTYNCGLFRASCLSDISLRITSFSCSLPGDLDMILIIPDDVLPR
jgi:hypothetical protein